MNNCLCRIYWVNVSSAVILQVHDDSIRSRSLWVTSCDLLLMKDRLVSAPAELGTM
ncbi:MAG: hypothetical protein V4507_04920 [Verrucomicrobiota bacterium]